MKNDSNQKSFISLKINAYLFEKREEILLEGEVNPDLFDFPEFDLFKKAMKIFIHLKIQKVEENFLIRGESKGTFQCSCSRDLNLFSKTFEFPDIFLFLEKPSLPEINISDLFREEILINLPNHLTCIDADQPQECQKILEKYLSVDKKSKNCIGNFFDS